MQWPHHRLPEGWSPVLPPVPPPAGIATGVIEVEEEESGDALPLELLKLASFLLELRDQAHIVHLNYEGSNFFEVHRFFQEQYDAIAGHFDTIAEHVRALGYKLPVSSVELRGLCDCFCHCPSGRGDVMLNAYGSNLDKAATIASTISPNCRGMEMLDVENSLAEVTAHCRKGAWMLAATLAPA